MADYPFHGWGIGPDSPTLKIGYVPGRPRPVLYAEHGPALAVFAHFRSETDAITASRIIDRLLGLETGAVEEALVTLPDPEDS